MTTAPTHHTPQAATDLVVEPCTLSELYRTAKAYRDEARALRRENAWLREQRDSAAVLVGRMCDAAKARQWVDMASLACKLKRSFMD